MARKFLIFFILGAPLLIVAQRDSVRAVRQIALFVPLYLDSAFDESGSYRFDNSFPKFLNPGIEFFEGAQLAMDSLKKDGVNLELTVYDTRSNQKPLARLLKGDELNKTDLIIGHVSASELRLLAAAAASRNIPFINANLPNEGNASDNPDLVILNSTVKTHCEAIYKYLQKNYATQTLYLFGRKNASDEKLKSYFINLSQSKGRLALNIKYILLENNFETKLFRPYLDSNIHNVLIAASLDEGFAKNFCFQLSPLAKSYPATVIGMPTWDNVSDFSLPLYNGLEIIYTTPFYLNANDSLVSQIQQYFRSNYYMRPSDMVYRGLETVYHFGRLLAEHPTNLREFLGENRFLLFDPFDIEPVYLNNQGPKPDYFENKYLFFVKKADGITSLVK